MNGERLQKERIRQLDPSELIKRLTAELENFEDIAKCLDPVPGDVPHLRGIDIWGGTLPLSGQAGGDHLIYMDFNQRFDLDARIAQAIAAGLPDVVNNLRRCQRTAGVALLDVTGHRMTDGLVAAMMHQAFLVGSVYELDMFGQVTRRLFENLNMQFYRSSGEHKFVSLTYAEISEDGNFRFLSAAQPLPAVFSNRYERFMPVHKRLLRSAPPVGLMPSSDVTDGPNADSVLGFKEHYEMNEWWLVGQGDILLLLTDGVTEHENASGAYFPEHLEQTLRMVKRLTAIEIYDAILEDLVRFDEPADDVSIVVVKRL